MPELAEVEFFRKQWTPGAGQKILRVALHGTKRLFRGTDADLISARLAGAKFLAAEARGKQLLFRFSPHAWLGIHLGMSGRLSAEPADFVPGKHDHLVLVQKRRTLVFHDPRMFGRVQFQLSRTAPKWWTEIPPAITSPEFTKAWMADFLARHPKLALKAALLLQSGFAGVGNWMADEILWQARLDPRHPAGKLTAAEITTLYRVARKVCKVALATIGVDWSDPPKSWLIHVRWKASGCCPRDHLPLKTATIGGRTTRWCPRCQK